MKSLHCVLACATAVAMIGCTRRQDPLNQASAEDDFNLTAGEITTLVEDAVIYGVPLVANYGVLYEHSIDEKSRDFKAPLNTIHHESRVYSYRDRSIVTPNSDTPYSSVMMDLRTEPVVLSVPKVEGGRYFSVQLCDGNAFNYGYIGTRVTGNEEGDYLVAGPGWQGDAPAGVKKVFRSSTQFSIAIFRTQLFNSEDIDNVKKIQAGYRSRALSEYLNQPAPPPPPDMKFPVFRKALMMPKFFDYLDFALQFAPPGPEETASRERLARIGVGSGKRFEFRKLSLRHKVEVTAGMEAAALKIAKYALTQQPVNGWVNCDLFGDRAFYNGDWLKRAASVGGGIFGNDGAEALYFRATTLANGQRLDTRNAGYTVTFPAGGLPPVDAFWSLTAYNGLTFLLIKNPIDRYLINSAMVPGMKTNPDGSLTIYIQKDSPGPDKESNWLPGRDGIIMLVLRLYLPKPEVFNGTWKPPVIEIDQP